MTLVIALPLMSLLSQSPIPYEQAAREQIACAPISLPAKPTNGLRLIGGSVPGRYLFGPGDAVIVNAGTAQGLQKGQQYFVRRYVKDYFTPMYTDVSSHSVHTAGWVTIVDAKNDLSVATVTHACDGIIEGDYLEPFVDPVFPPAAIAGAPDFDHPGRIVMRKALEKIDGLSAKYQSGRVYSMDGVSVEFPDWHFNVRGSNTEPMLRLNLEATTEKLMEEKRDEVLSYIRS